MSSLYERRQLIVGASAVAIAGAAFAAQPRRNLVDFTHTPLSRLLPLSVPPWVGTEDEDVVPETVDASIDHGQTLSLRYASAASEPIMLVASYHGPQSPDLKVHRPETCYKVAGFADQGRQVMRTPLGRGLQLPAVTFTARREQRIETVLYWTRVGDRFPQSLSEQRLAFLGEALRGIRADGLLMRASMIGVDPAASVAILTRFGRALVEAASPEGRRLLVGPAMARRLEA